MITLKKNTPNLESITSGFQKLKDQLDMLVATNVDKVSQLHTEILEREASIHELDVESGKAIQITNHLDKLLGN